MNGQSFSKFIRYEYHKGFYNEPNIFRALQNVRYEDFFEEPKDEEFPFNSAYELLCGSCNHFALTLKKCLVIRHILFKEETVEVFTPFAKFIKVENGIM